MDDNFKLPISAYAPGCVPKVEIKERLNNAKLPWVLFALFIIVSFLFCLLLLVGFVWFGVESIILGVIMTGIIGIVLDLGLAFFCVYGWYKQLFGKS